MKKESELNNEYFEAAKDWYFDRYAAAKIQANRWFAAFIAAALIAALLAISLIVLMPLKTLIPMVIHQNTLTGEVWVDRPKTPYAPANDAQVQSDIVRYITARESYSADDINQRYHVAMLLSAGNVGTEYANEQMNSNPKAPVNILAKEGVRTVRVEDVIFIDKTGTQELRKFRQPSHSLAKVDFVTTTINRGVKKQEAWVATIGWIYKGLPENQQDAWDNWNGFSVNTYRVDQRNIEVKD
jgi:type IV secretion system protein VirB8